MKYICRDCKQETYEEPCILELQLKPDLKPFRCPFGFIGGTWEIFIEQASKPDVEDRCAVCGRTPAKYTNGKDTLCSTHKRSAHT